MNNSAGELGSKVKTNGVRVDDLNETIMTSLGGKIKGLGFNVRRPWSLPFEILSGQLTVGVFTFNGIRDGLESFSTIDRFSSTGKRRDTISNGKNKSILLGIVRNRYSTGITAVAPQ